MQGWHIAPENVETCAPAPDFLNDCAREAAELRWFMQTNKRSRIADCIIDILAEYGPLTAAQILTRTVNTRSAVDHVIREMLQNGQVVVVGRAVAKNAPRIYGLPEVTP